MEHKRSSGIHTIYEDAALLNFHSIIHSSTKFGQKLTQFTKCTTCRRLNTGDDGSEISAIRTLKFINITLGDCLVQFPAMSWVCSIYYSLHTSVYHSPHRSILDHESEFRHTVPDFNTRVNEISTSQDDFIILNLILQYFMSELEITNIARSNDKRYYCNGLFASCKYTYSRYGFGLVKLFSKAPVQHDTNSYFDNPYVNKYYGQDEFNGLVRLSGPRETTLSLWDPLSIVRTNLVSYDQVKKATRLLRTKLNHYITRSNAVVIMERYHLRGVRSVFYAVTLLENVLRIFSDVVALLSIRDSVPGSISLRSGYQIKPRILSSLAGCSTYYSTRYIQRLKHSFNMMRYLGFYELTTGDPNYTDEEISAMKQALFTYDRGESHSRLMFSAFLRELFSVFDSFVCSCFTYQVANLFYASENADAVMYFKHLFVDIRCASLLDFTLELLFDCDGRTVYIISLLLDQHDPEVSNELYEYAGSLIDFESSEEAELSDYTEYYPSSFDESSSLELT